MSQLHEIITLARSLAWRADSDRTSLDQQRKRTVSGLGLPPRRPPHPIKTLSNLSTRTRRSSRLTTTTSGDGLVPAAAAAAAAALDTAVPRSARTTSSTGRNRMRRPSLRMTSSLAFVDAVSQAVSLDADSRNPSQRQSAEDFASARADLSFAGDTHSHSEEAPDVDEGAARAIDLIPSKLEQAFKLVSMDGHDQSESTSPKVAAYKPEV